MAHKKEIGIPGLTDTQSQYIRNLQESCDPKEWNDSINKFRDYNSRRK